MIRFSLVLILAGFFIAGVLSAASSAPAVSLLTAPKSAEVTLELSHQYYGEHFAFPKIQNWKSLHIIFFRSPCFGWCPAYTVEITGDGAVRFDGKFCVEAKGQHVSGISQEKLRALFGAFEHADFFSLKSEYGEGIVDAPGVGITLEYDHWKKQVIDRAFTTDMPAPAALLPDLIDKTANTAVWIGHPKPTCMSDR